MSFYAEIMMHTALFMGFLPLFYFTFVAPIQVSSLVNDLFEIIQPTLTTGAVLSTPGQVTQLEKSISNDFEMGEQDPTIQAAGQSMLQKNHETVKTLTLIVAITAPVLFVLAILLEFYSGGSVFNLLISNLIVLFFIAISEYAIVGLFLKNFMEIDSDYMKAIYASQYVDPKSNRCENVKNFEKSLLGDSLYKKLIG